MTKKQILDYIDFLIEDEKEAIEGYNKGINKMSDSPRIVDLFGRIYQEETRHITDLQNLKEMVEKHEEVVNEMQLNRLFNTPCGPDGCCSPYDGDGINFDPDEKETD